ncbi:shikimate dehydrogenase [Salinibacterium sp. SYSU T00001]|uniref:shikimate dehydrogenase n=1 Tax=Homoserinimonas sedimenticola TaxID=2986805 RepID=UPI00223646AB|nr:shikimate dehydrogenase [Salinibacterium sedimenticola]MCW4385481.1 shikimate dehydrogenase [Salinibacterium sedimenticola]
MSVAGESYLVGLIGSGITHSLTPPMHEQEADRLGLRYLYRPIDLDVIDRGGDQVGSILAWARDLGYSAFNVTFPCKQTVIEHLDELSESAEMLGSVNTVLVQNGALVGHNTDHSGFAWGLTRGLPEADMSRVVQLGSGGAGSAVAYALLSRGARELRIADLDASRAERLAQAMASAFPDRIVAALDMAETASAIEQATGLVNTTPVGMHHHPGLPVHESVLHQGLWVADVVYRPLRTQLVNLAEDRGCRVLDGGHMAVGQAIDTFELITGLAPDAQRMRAHFDDLIAHGL